MFNFVRNLLNKMKPILLKLSLLLFTLNVFGQTGTIKGKIFNNLNNEPIPFANVIIEGTNMGAASDLEGNYSISNLSPGIYNVICSTIGYKTSRISEVTVSSVRPTIVNFPLAESATDLSEVLITASPFTKTEESPLSLRTISAAEIFRNPGGNRDISRVIQSLPGVASSVSFRNDIIIRGGAPNENRFFLDGIEVPNINHFATQGSSGGPVGLINVNFIREVDFYSSAFPAARGNAMSSVFEFKQIEGNPDRLRGSFMVGSSDAGLTLDGPIGKKSNFIFSARRSYLQFLFKALALPFLPTYNDFQFKQTFRPNDKNTFTILGLGAIDDFTLNKEANKGVTDTALIARNNYILGNIPVNNQWNYTIGGSWKRFFSNSYMTLFVSRNHLNNSSVKFRDNIEEAGNELLNYNSGEIENKLRWEYNTKFGAWKVNFGAGYENATYTVSTFNKIIVGGNLAIIDFDSKLNMSKFAAFGQANRSFWDERLSVSLGLRTDFSDYSAQMINPLKQLSPRFAASYVITEKVSFNFNTGRYFQLPPYTILGYRNAQGLLENKDNGIKYIMSDHIVSGFEYNTGKFAKITIEGFYKQYNNYPFLIRDSISLANLGADFGVIGNEPASPNSKGRSYGVEFLAQQKLSKSVYGIFSYTFVRSEFTDKSGKYKPSAWDNRHIVNMTGGKRLPKNWELGMRFRLQGGAPYTPYDLLLSSQRTVWDVRQQGILDFNRVNEERFPVVHAMDIRIDKKWFRKKWSFNLYLDVQNIYNFQAQTLPFINVVRDAKGQPVTDPANPSAYQTYLIPNTAGTRLPSIGLMLEF
jgi:outer membrane receptor for ferrienterochelin and colicin